MAEHLTYGLHPVLALLNNPLRKTYKLYVSKNRKDKRLQDALDAALHAKIPVESLTAEALKQRFGDISHQGIVAEAEPLKSYIEADLPELLDAAPKPVLILILDGVTDPHNLGACLRSADAAGVNFVIAPKDNSADITPVVSKVASGAAESVPFIRVTNLARSIKTLKEAGVWVYGAAGEATQSIYDLNYKTTSTALVLGAEGSGLRRLTRDVCDDLFSLPMQGQVSSLNVSVATGICLYEALRQRLT
ncbi:MAG: 23S rRNA (guanosine(2251)-2'-O)-methyltransferase RlmB [Gammaproteobacteria bacterium]|nr:23S rRNA (guanosine(2251)-2'-O)-methyltransferase RlmB [Gammaproteobacteria bacterium]MCH9764268.1 23S rRNA (guanosine(2251)-2'-O)-methyltransferase RlmB [Gammaproteobacteria bacterium]